MPVRTFAVLLVCALATGPVTAVRAAETGAFVIRLGDDTTAVERYERDGDRLVVDQVGRSPRVMRRHYEYLLAGDEVRHLTLTVTASGSPTPISIVEVDAAPGDSVRVTTTDPKSGTTRSALALPAGTLIVPGSSAWVGYQTRTMRLVSSKAESLTGQMWFVGSGPTPYWLRLHRLHRDGIRIANGHDDVFETKIDKDGRILLVRPVSGTAKFSVDRVERLDVDAYAASFAAREQSGGAMGMLSPRDSVVTTAGGASLWIDYGRPGKRGRVVFGEVVPFGEVWRTGANAATQFRTDKPLDFGGTVVPAGSYTLWTIPAREGWKLIFNTQTGQWGTAHDPTRDLVTVTMAVAVLPAPVERFTIAVDPSANGGTLRFEWDTTRASAAFTVNP